MPRRRRVFGRLRPSPGTNWMASRALEDGEGIVTIHSSGAVSLPRRFYGETTTSVSPDKGDIVSRVRAAARGATDMRGFRSSIVVALLLGAPGRDALHSARWAPVSYP